MRELGPAQILREVRFACRIAIVAGQVVLELPQELRELLVGGGGELAPKTITKVGHDLVGIDDPRNQFQADAEDGDRWVQQSGIDGRNERLDGRVCGDQVPVTIEDDRRIRLVTSQNALQGLADRSEFGRAERVLGERWSVACGEQ
ncbi:MAG: hypothetical protein QM662_03550 [Gordonia sp. (in: high G+C Gram-positive bacteria)]